MRLSAISLSMYLIGTISASPYPAGGSGSVSESKEPVKSAFKWFRGFGINKPKEPQDTQTQEHDNEDTTTSNVGPEHDPPGFTDVFLGPDEDINAEVGSTEESEDFTPGQIQNEDHEEDSPEPKGTTQRSSIWSEFKESIKIPEECLFRSKGTTQISSIWSEFKENIKIPEECLFRPKGASERVDKSPKASDTDKPKEPQDTQTQEQSDEDITTPNVGPEHDSSDSTGAATGSDEATNTDVHQEEENEGSTAEQTQAEVHREESPKPEETVQSPSKLAESAQEIMKLLKLPNLPNLPSLNTNFQNPMEWLESKQKQKTTFKDPKAEDKVDMWDILSSQ
ncbi:hypothetical protein BASA61_009097 [Batrachochytrium salamandrivorans]|nr:hypothetical protein BASA61_009097 [Batrachochytrium salamandrivorans]